MNTVEVGRLLAGKVAVVTGGASGLGRAISRRFVEAGATVVVADLSGDVESIAAELGAARGIKADVSSGADVQNVVATVVEEYGALHVWCNNAGIDRDIVELTATDESVLDELIAVNLRGVFLGMKYAIPALLDAGGGTIVNVASTTALVGTPGQTAYSATKGGVVSLTRSAAAEYASRGVRVNVVCPGVFTTPMWQALVDRYTPQPGFEQLEAATIAGHPMGRLGDPAELADAVLFLASDLSSFVTGVALPVDGGAVAV